MTRYFISGVLFGILITKAEVTSWFRIQEMFRFQGVHMFGVFATALPMAILTVQLRKRRSAKALSGEPIVIPPKQLGSGITVIAAAILGALAGTWTYALLQPRLPH